MKTPWLPKPIMPQKQKVRKLPCKDCKGQGKLHCLFTGVSFDCTSCGGKGFK